MWTAENATKIQKQFKILNNKSINKLYRKSTACNGSCIVFYRSRLISHPNHRHCCSSSPPHRHPGLAPGLAPAPCHSHCIEKKALRHDNARKTYFWLQSNAQVSWHWNKHSRHSSPFKPLQETSQSMYVELFSQESMQSSWHLGSTDPLYPLRII